MNETETQGQWAAFVCCINPDGNPTSSQTPEYDRETELLREADYETSPIGRGMTYHETEADARSAAWDMVGRLSALDPAIKWFGIHFCIPCPVTC